MPMTAIALAVRDHGRHDDLMSMEGLRSALDPGVGDWIAPRLRGGFGAVCRSIPRGYPAYARLLHPVEPDAAEPRTWAEVCERTGRTAHALMQWEAITTPAPAPRSGVEVALSRDGRWEEVQVQCGTLAPEALRPLLDVLAPFTGDQDCYQALWEGWGWLTGGSTFLAFSTSDGSRPQTPARAAPPDVLERALNAERLSLPGRDYLMFSGPLHTAMDMGNQITQEWFDPQSPNLMWPADRSWCLASEIDFDSTLLAGPAKLIDAVLASPTLEAWAVEEDDDLSAFADQLNA
jgi:hypothetical protein